jgi:hypothetical protein
LAVAFARAAIVSNPDRHFDNEMLLDVIRDARVDLDLQPGGDPAEALFGWIEDRTQLNEKARAENEEIERLTDKLNSTLAALDEKKKVLREREQSLGVVSAQLEKARDSTAAGPEKREESVTFGSEKEATLRRLRDQVEGLKAEIDAQQAERRQLRKLLTTERKKATTSSELASPAERTGAVEEATVVEPSGRPLLPEYADAFRKRCASLPAAVAAKAILAAGRFASHEAAIWRQTKPLERLPGHYRIRIGLDYRMIVRWQPGKSLQVLDVIPRQDLESWIKRQG